MHHRSVQVDNLERMEKIRKYFVLTVKCTDISYLFRFYLFCLLILFIVTCSNISEDALGILGLAHLFVSLYYTTVTLKGIRKTSLLAGFQIWRIEMPIFI